MKKTRARFLLLAGIHGLSVVLPACTTGYEDEYGGTIDFGVGVEVYGGYYGPGWGGCCAGGAIVPAPVPIVRPTPYYR